MSQEIINQSLQHNLLSPLTVDPLWSQFLHAFSYELDNLRTYFGTIENAFNIYKNEKDGIIRIAESFGYEPNLVINNSQYMATKEAESIPYKIKRKSTYDGYYMILQQNSQLGEVFCYYFNNKKLIKSIDYTKTIKNLNNSEPYLPFYGVVPIKNFTSMLNVDMIMLDYLDSDGQEILDSDGLRLFSLDQVSFNPYWRLDKQCSKNPTKHIGIEYYPQHYYCEYFTNLGVAIDDVDTYTTYFKMLDHYVPQSINVSINNKLLNLIVHTENGIEYYSDVEGILNPQSNYDISSGKLTLIFDVVPDSYEIVVSYNIDLLLTSDYFYCLEFGAEYNKRCPIIPHAGVFLSANISQGRGSDFYFPNEEGYTIPQLKLKASTTSAYNREITITDEMKLDNATDEWGVPIPGKENFHLDSTIKWFLDSISSSTSMTEKFKYISYGDGALPIMNEECSKIFSYLNLLFSYNLNSDNDSTEILDASKNRIHCTVVGSPIKIDGIIDKSLNFDGETYAHSTSRLNIVSTDSYSFGIWFNADKQPSTSIETIFDNFINISYDYENEKLLLDSNEINCSKKEPHFLCINFNGTDSEMEVYLDSVLVDTLSFTIPSMSDYIYIGCDNSNNNKFYGLIDNLWMMNKLISANTVKYVYDNKITIISHMGNRLGFYELSEDEIYNDDVYTLIQSYVKTMDVVHEISVVNDADSNYYTSQTRFKPIYKPYFTIKYKNSLHESITLNADENGNFYRKINETDNEIVTGGIDFETGIWNLAKNSIKSIAQEELESPDVATLDVAYKITNNQGNFAWYYSYTEYNDTHGDEIHADDYKDDIYVNYEKTSIYVSKDDDLSNYVKIYTKDNENYYIYERSIAHQQIYIKAFVVNGDSFETHLFSSDNGATLYHNLNDLLIDLLNKSNNINETNRLHAFIDLGEFSSTTIYTNANISDDNFIPTTENMKAYLDVKCTREIHKHKDGNTLCYSLGANSSVYYTDLSFNSIYIPQNTPDNEPFNPLEMAIKSEETSLNLDILETVEKYEPIQTIDYVRGVHKKITLLNVNVEQSSIKLDYWITVDGKLKRYTAYVDENGNVKGENIASGSFDKLTNMLDFDFVTSLNSSVVASYDYKLQLDIDLNESLIINYKVTKNIKINEIGLEDENHELLAYMTFPSIEPNNIYNNISAMFAINKS